jgi:hypothetical protein
MSFTYGSSIGYETGNYNGDGQFITRNPLPNQFLERLQKPNVRNVFLVKITAGQWLRGAVATSGVFSYAVPTWVDEVRVNNSQASLAKVASLATCQATAASFYHDPNAGLLYVNPPTGRSVYVDTFQALLTFRFAKAAREFGGYFWEPRVQSVPNLSLRIESRFSGVGQIGGGKLSLNNADGFFDALDDNTQWDAGTVTIDMGIDLADGSDNMEEEDYQRLGTWRVEQTEKGDTSFDLTLKEFKTRLENQIPHDLFTREEFPALPNDLVGKPIPWAWGKIFSAKPRLIDASARKFKLAAHPIRSIDSVKVLQDDGNWKEVPTATQDLQKAEFTLSAANWEGSEDVGVDFEGRKTPSGDLMENPADIMVDLLNYVGERTFDAESFNAARAWYRVGLDRYGKEVTSLAPSIYLENQKAAIDVAGQINEVAGSFLFVDIAGNWRFAAFRPVRASELDPNASQLITTLTEKEIIEGTIKKHVDSRKILSRLSVAYAQRHQENWSERVTVERSENQLLHNLPTEFLEERTVSLWKLKDAQYWGERFLTTEAEPVTKYSFSVPWLGFFLLPGDKLHVTHSRYDLDTVLEVLEVNYDLVSNNVKLVVANLRGWGDTFGFWVESGAPAVPPTGMRLWLKPDSLHYTDGQPVSVWPDASGYNNHARQSEVKSQPTYYQGGASSYPMVDCLPRLIDGALVGQWLTLPPELTDSGALTEGEIFAVVQANNDPASVDNQIWKFGTLGDTYPENLGSIVTSFGRTSQTIAGNPTAPLTSWQLYNVASKAGNLLVNLGNQTLYNIDPENGVAFSSFIYLGKSDSGNFAGKFAEIIFYNRVLSASERTQVKQYLSDKYNLGLLAATANLPWNTGWTDAQAAEARQNAGYWTGKDAGTNTKETGMANATDRRSFWPSRWF